MTRLRYSLREAHASRSAQASRTCSDWGRNRTRAGVSTDRAAELAERRRTRDRSRRGSGVAHRAAQGRARSRARASCSMPRCGAPTTARRRPGSAGGSRRAPPVSSCSSGSSIERRTDQPAERPRALSRGGGERGHANAGMAPAPAVPRSRSVRARASTCHRTRSTVLTGPDVGERAHPIGAIRSARSETGREVRLAERRSQDGVVAPGQQVQRLAHHSRFHHRSPAPELALERGGAEARRARPDPDVRGGWPLRLHANQPLEHGRRPRDASVRAGAGARASPGSARADVRTRSATRSSRG